MNAIATFGALMIAAAVAIFVINVWISRRRGALAGADPWGGGTLEWSVPSPPPACNFAAPPVVHGSNPMWEPRKEPSAVAGLATNAREVLVTTVLDARPDTRTTFPSPTQWPFWSALATTVLFVGSIFTPWAVVWGAVPVAIGMTLWFWPKARELRGSVALERTP